MPSRSYRVRGVVQGVFYRSFTADAASRHGVAGFARNLPDGSVEVVAQGPEAALAALRADLETGPPASRVDGVDESAVVPAEAFTAFTIRD